MPFRDARIFKLDKAHLSKFADVSPQEAKEVETRLYKEGIVKTSLWDFEFMPHSNRVCATRAYFPPENEESHQEVVALCQCDYCKYLRGELSMETRKTNVCAATLDSLKEEKNE